MHFEISLGRHGDRVVLSLDEILPAFGQVLAELLAGDDDDVRVKRVLIHWAREIYQKSRDLKARGEAVGEFLRPC
jgi:hypothetical protein